MIECRALSKRFQDFIAVDNVTFEVRGGICALLGPNGAGKSTLLKLLTGLMPPDAGSVRICGVDVREDVRKLIGVVPEDLGLFDLLTIEEHLKLTGAIYGVSDEETRERADSLIRVLNLGKGGNTFLDQCSHGMRKKTALAMALLQNPRVLFLDEPFEGIDPVSSQAIRDLLASVAKRGVTVFLTSHTLPVISELATDMLMIRGGRIVWNSAHAPLPPESSLKKLYFELVESAPVEDLAWLGRPQD